MSRKWQHIQGCLGDEAERAFGAAEHGIEVEAPIHVAQMREIIAGETAVQLRKALSNKVGGLALQRVDLAVNTGGEARPGLGRFQCPCFQRRRPQDRAIGQNGAQLQDVVAGLAIKTRPLPAGISRDHTANGGSVRSRQFGRKEKAIRRQRRVQLILDDACLHPDPARRHVDLENPGHVAR